MTIQFSQQGMAALPLHVRPGHTSLVRRLLSARNDPAKARVLAWLVKIDDERLAGYGFTSEDIAILRSRSSGTSPCGSQILPTSPKVRLGA